MADVLAVRDQYRAETWATIIQDCQDSGLSNKEFCRQRGVSEKSYYYWLRKFRQQITAAAEPQLVPLDTAAEQDDLLRISFRGAELKLPCSVDLDAVAALLKSIQNHD